MKRPQKGKKAGGNRARPGKKTGDERNKPEPKEPGKAKPLTGKSIRALRAMGHHLDPLVQIGKEGITDALVAAVAEQLLAHELIKVRVGTEAPVERKDAGAELAERAGAVLAQTLGRTLLLYKRHPSKPRIELPR